MTCTGAKFEMHLPSQLYNGLWVRDYESGSGRSAFIQKQSHFPGVGHGTPGSLDAVLQYKNKKNPLANRTEKCQPSKTTQRKGWSELKVALIDCSQVQDIVLAALCTRWTSPLCEVQPVRYFGVTVQFPLSLSRTINATTQLCLRKWIILYSVVKLSHWLSLLPLNLFVSKHPLKCQCNKSYCPDTYFDTKVWTQSANRKVN